jgi:cytochrome P450
MVEKSDLLRFHKELAFSMPIEGINPAQPHLFQQNVILPYFERLRRDDPVHFCKEHEFGPYWSITKHSDLLTVSADHEKFSSEGGITIVNQGAIEGALPMFIAMDPPDHTVRRRTVVPAFTGPSVKELEHQIRERVASILNELPIGDEFDWVDKVATELTAMTIATLFDIPQSDRRMLTRWADVVTSPVGPGHLVASLDDKIAIFREFNDYFTRLWNKRVNAPPSRDLISMLAHGETTRGMNQKEFFGTIMLLTVAGTDTTRSSIAGSLLGLNLFPGEYARLRADPALIPAMVDETIRWQSPLAHARRTALVDAEIRGRKIRKGDKVILWFLSANHDEEIYPNPGYFHIGRKFSTIPTTFGHGIHRCVGNRLAEMQLRVLWEEILKRFPEIMVVEEPVRLPTTYIAGYRSMKTVIPSRKK